MPRQVRIEYPGAVYHVMSRGNRRQNIYLDDVDRQDFLKTLAEACQKTCWQVHAFCLMSNHYHLVLETPNANLVAGMGCFGRGRLHATKTRGLVFILLCNILEAAAASDGRHQTGI